jgi:hypothetical protein
VTINPNGSHNKPANAPPNILELVEFGRSKPLVKDTMLKVQSFQGPLIFGIQ